VLSVLARNFASAVLGATVTTRSWSGVTSAVSMARATASRSATPLLAEVGEKMRTRSPVRRM
jgi:hypothetical protein